MKRKVPLRRSAAPQRRSWLRRSGRPRAESQGHRERRLAYGPLREAYLEEHPFCQVTIARYTFRETDVLARARGLNRSNCQGIFYQGILIPIATEIHHRNKARGPRKTDVRFWISSSRKGHDWIEDEKKAARATGFLLPFEADQDGRLPDGTFGLQTPAFMKSREVIVAPENRA